MYTVANVAVENAAVNFDRAYSYLVPPDCPAQVGCRVRVPFGRGGGRRTGLVLELEQREETQGLKALDELLDPSPLLNGEGMRLLRYLKQCAFCTWFDALRALIPAGVGVRGSISYAVGRGDGASLSLEQQQLVEAAGKAKSPLSRERLFRKAGLEEGDAQLAGLRDLVRRGVLEQTELLRQRVQDGKLVMVRTAGDSHGQKLTKGQKAVLEFLEEAGTASLKELCYYAGVTRAVPDNLVKKGLLEYYDRPVLRSPYQVGESPTELPPPLTPAQAQALEELGAGLDDPGEGPWLLYGVTGSGKTQVFLRLIRQALDRGKSALVLVPEISLTSQAVESFHRRFGRRVAVLHSGLSLGERMDEWKRIRAGEADIVVGTRSAVFAPLENLGLVVIDEEQEHTYKSEQSPRYHAREVARVRCSHHGAMLLLASATPSVESYHAATQGKGRLVVLADRFNQAPLPAVEVVDMTVPENHSEVPGLSLPLVQALCDNLAQGRQSILLLNRRGYSTVVKCSACGTVAECPHCSVALTYHAANGHLLCHYCGYVQPPATDCGLCGSGLVRYAGSGTQRLEEQLAALLPAARVLRVDMDTTMRKFSHERLFHSFAAGEYDIMVGTQMVAKGLNFPQVTLVGVLSADQALYNGDFRSYERAFSLLTQVVGRSGRGAGEGRAVVQTYTPENPIIQLAARQDYPAFFREEIGSRRLHLYPPFCSMVGIGFVGTDLAQVRQWSERFLERFRELATGAYRDLPVRLLGPIPYDQLKAAGRFRYKLILKCRQGPRIRRLLEEMRQWFAGECRTVSLVVDMYYDRM